ncbi:MAG: 5'/3'-nucleotidase SurE [Sedimentisphaeraceae bacterium JB056]
MRILLTNDDGIFAPTMHYLYSELSRFAEVVVVAPHKGKSGSSHSLTLSPIVCEKATVDGLFTGYAVAANPADCVKLAVLELVNKPLDLIVSGLNIGSNAGVDICYSGTVAAAMEGAFYGIPSVAVSARASGEQNYKKAASVAAELINTIRHNIDAGEVININIPVITDQSPKGIKVVRQSESIYQEYYAKKKNEDNKDTYQIRCSYFRETDKETDVHALAEGYVTLTPLKYNRTDKKILEKFKSMDQRKLWPQKK